MNIEIYNKKTGEVEETIKNVKTLKGFLSYWALQCNSQTYGYRIKGGLK